MESNQTNGTGLTEHLKLKRKTLEFDALPLVETHIRAVFDQPIPLTFQRGRNLATEMESFGFKDIVNEDVLRQTPGQPLLINIPLGGVIALSFHTDFGMRIRVQPDMIEAEWLSNVEPEYPRFPRMLKAIEQTVQCIQAVESGEVRFSIANMSYSNLIDFEQAPTVSLINEYFGFHLDVPGSGEQIHHFEAAWTGEIDHRFSIQAATNAPNESATKIIVTNTAGIRLGLSTDLGLELTRVHDFLIKWFSELLTAKAKHEFKYEE